MTPEERILYALDHATAAKKAIERADLEPDPVEQRRLYVQAARHYRAAADFLDDQGRLSE
jgi:hypothetical protein